MYDLENLSFKDFITLASGTDEQKMAKSVMGLNWENWHTDGKDPETVDEYVPETPTIKLFKHAGYLQVDLCFGSRFNPELTTAWNFLERFCDSANSIDENDTAVSVLITSIVPVETEGKAYALCSNPIFHTLQPEQVGQEATVIRLVFDEEDCQLYREQENNN